MSIQFFCRHGQVYFVCLGVKIRTLHLQHNLSSALDKRNLQSGINRIDVCKKTVAGYREVYPEYGSLDPSSSLVVKFDDNIFTETNIVGLLVAPLFIAQHLSDYDISCSPHVASVLRGQTPIVSMLNAFLIHLSGFGLVFFKRVSINGIAHAANERRAPRF